MRCEVPGGCLSPSENNKRIRDSIGRGHVLAAQSEIWDDFVSRGYDLVLLSLFFGFFEIADGGTSKE